MPFISKDWRSPGEEWVRYEGGWELKKTLSGSLKTRQFLCDVLDIEKDLMEPSFVVGSLFERRPRCQKQMRRTMMRNDENLQEREIANQENNDNNDINDLIAVINNNNERKRRYSGTILMRLDNQTQPFCPITLKNTREVAGFNELAEAMLRLDMIQAVKDVRRFNYVSKLMFLLFNHDKLSQLPGNAQKILFRMLEEMATTVYKTNQNQHVLRTLMEELHTTMTIYNVWGSHLGSSMLFKQHLESRRKITEFVEKMQVEFKQDLATPGLVKSLPEECIREILLRLSDANDLENVGRVCQTMGFIATEKRVWRELVQTHFTKQQIDIILQTRPDLGDNNDWKELYKALRRRYGLREEYTEVIMLCKKCSSLYWQSLGHPCFIPEEEKSERIFDGNIGFDDLDIDENTDLRFGLLPAEFLSFFSI